MNSRFILFCVLFCAVSGGNNSSGNVSDASRSLSKGVHTVKEVFDIKKEIEDIRRNSRFGKRPRRYSEKPNSNAADNIFNKVTAGIYAGLKTYVYQPIAHGNFQESTIRGYGMMKGEKGRFLFGTLDGELNQSFKSIMRKRRPRTGDIISCRIPSNRMAEHYMMVINDKIAEVGVVGGKETHNGVIMYQSYRQSSYINSTECLHHENRVISRAEQIDDQNGNDKESDLKYEEILNRFHCTRDRGNSGHFYYDVWTCNCQDLVLYWAYGVVETNCIPSGFSQCSNYLTYRSDDLTGYVDETGYHKDLHYNLVLDFYE